MKTLFKIGMLAVAALAFAGCSIEVDNTVEQKTGTHTLTFTVQKDVDTRTAVIEGDGVASYVWTEEDEQYFHIYENGLPATEIVMELSADKKIATFLASFSNTDATEFVYTATYGSDLANSKPYNPVVPVDQKPTLSSFDPAADILVSAEPITFEGSAKAAEDTEFKFILNRVVSANKMTLKGLEAGETVKTVKLTSTDKYFSARYMISDGSFANSKKELTFDYTENAEATVGSDGTFPVYFISAPVDDASFSVSVTTDKHVYSREMTSKLTLAAGTFRRFGINLSGYGEVISSGTVYTLVESQDDLYSGATYIIAAAADDVVMGLYTGGNNHPKVDVAKGTDSAGNTIITVDNTLAVEPVTITESGNTWVIQNAASGNGYEGQYLICATGDKDNHLKETSEEDSALKNWTISLDNGIALIVNANSAAVRNRIYYNSQNSGMFASYKEQTASNYYQIALYVDKTTCKELADPELSFEGDATINVAWDDKDSFVAPTLNNPHELTVSYSSSDEEVATVNATTGEISFVGNGTTTIIARSEKTSEYKAGSAQYTLTVSGAPIAYDFTSVAELNALVGSTSQEYNGILTNAVVSFVPASNTAIIKDETGSIMYYKKGHGLSQGQTFTGEISVEAIKYNNLYSEITSFVKGGTFTGSGATVAPETVTLSQISGDYDTWQNAYVQLSNLTVVSQSSKDINVTDGTNTYVVYDNTGSISVSANDIITAKGTITKYGTTEELKVWADTDLTVESTAVATPEITCSSNTVTITCATDGATIYYTIDGTDPTTASAVYSAPFAITETITVKAIAVKSGLVDSGIASETCVYSSGTAPDPETITFADLNLENGVQYSDPFDGGNFTITFAGGGNDGKYYTTGSGIRTYGGGTITIASDYEIASIKFTWDGNNAPTADVANPTGYSTTTKTWTGSANSVVLTRPSGSGHWRLQAVTVTYK